MTLASRPVPALPERFDAYLAKPGRAVICNRDPSGRYHWTMTTLGALEAVDDCRTIGGELVVVYKSRPST